MYSKLRTETVKHKMYNIQSQQKIIHNTWFNTEILLFKDFSIRFSRAVQNKCTTILHFNFMSCVCERASLRHTAGLMYCTYQLSLPRLPTWSRLLMALHVRQRYGTPKYDSVVCIKWTPSLSSRTSQGLLKLEDFSRLPLNFKDFPRLYEPCKK